MYVLNFICTQIAEVAEGPECSIHGYNGAERLQVFPLPSLEISLLHELVLSCTGWNSGRSLSWTRRVNLLHITGQGEIFERTGGLFCFCSFYRPQFCLIWGKIVTKLVKVTEWWVIIHVIFSYTTNVAFQSIWSKHWNCLGKWWSKSSHNLVQRLSCCSDAKRAGKTPNCTKVPRETSTWEGRSS